MRYARFFLCAALALFLTAGCKKESPAPQPATAALFELSAKPEILCDPAIPLTRMTLYGVKLGDPESAVPARVHTRFSGPTTAGTEDWREKNGAGVAYRVSEGKVTGFQLWGATLLDQLKITTEGGITERFGKADRVEEVPHRLSPPSTVYHYPARSLDIQWDPATKKIDNIGIRP